ncbi:hypothetical protein MLD38_019216 [Melastoma candidum]|uniref:Uncharacterized protein n=1 Tax=Melastoma candidum TaxID=119954 RepID=A0ACB9QZR9_9MYRT|nr:hypothetical protein MLD38_019216 [Melastoma candidum]
MQKLPLAGLYDCIHVLMMSSSARLDSVSTREDLLLVVVLGRKVGKEERDLYRPRVSVLDQVVVCVHARDFAEELLFMALSMIKSLANCLVMLRRATT